MIRTFFKGLGLCLLLGFFTTTHAAVTPDAPTNFITTWNTENSGTSANNQITIPGTGAGYNYEIYWENLASSTMNGTTSVITTSSHTLTFPEPGIYEVQASGTFPQIYFNNVGDKDKILTVEQWGDIAWVSMRFAFRGCSNLRVLATDAPDLSGVTDMAYMFNLAASFNEPINHWNVSNITDMQGVFHRAYKFNQPLDNWDVSSAVDMHSLFAYSAFNQNINNWDISKVKVISSMFLFNAQFNQPLNNWNTASVTSMRATFLGAPFDQDLSSWDMASIATSSAGNGAFNGLELMFLNSALSTQNLDSTLTSWAAQSLQSDVPFHLGLKTYSATGAAALATLRNTYNWDITEQYQAEYRSSSDAILEGTSIQSPLDLNSTTTAVTIVPKKHCTFIQWSDGNTDNPRTDVMTDNISVVAELSCSASQSTSARTQAIKSIQFGNPAQAEDILNKHNITLDTVTSTPKTTFTPPETLAESLALVKDIPKHLPNLDPVKDKEVIEKLISIFEELVELLRKLEVLKG
ncbi:DUF285 domain-containing protein [Candidatus Nomurabacteria bacterium]|nr:DUF285 domain-containing protein [Candidatus Kaiserbacteria bacterium]MCB9813856.1 DUF285 domain-containing protein [Candidatus Nomurabacteria bacterium]